jgi:hypothetical protein
MIFSTNVILLIYVDFYFSTLQEFHIMNLNMLDLASQLDNAFNKKTLMLLNVCVCIFAMIFQL